MKNTETQFLKENIFKLIKGNKSTTIDIILDYLDYVNKVKYSFSDIKPILDGLILENKIFFDGNTYSVKKNL